MDQLIKYVVRVAETEKPIAVFSSKEAAIDYCKVYSKKKLYVTTHIIGEYSHSKHS